jgi:hypothetical protein
MKYFGSPTSRLRLIFRPGPNGSECELTLDLSSPVKNEVIIVGLGRSHSTTAETFTESSLVGGAVAIPHEFLNFICVLPAVSAGNIPALLWLCRCPTSLIGTLQVVCLGSPAYSTHRRGRKSPGYATQEDPGHKGLHLDCSRGSFRRWRVLACSGRRRVTKIRSRWPAQIAGSCIVADFC